MNLKRWTVCMVAGHKWVSVPYEQHGDSGRFKRCLRCRHEYHGGGSTVATGAPLGM